MILPGKAFPGCDARLARGRSHTWPHAPCAPLFRGAGAVKQGLPKGFPGMKYERGFTLIESMIALMVISIGLLAIGSFTISVMSADALARERIMATHIAEQVLEEWAQTGALATFGITTPATPVSIADTDTQTATYTPTAVVSVAYTISATANAMIAPLPDGAGNVADSMLTGTPTPIEKEVTVSWTHKGKAYSISLSHSTLR